MASKPGNRLPPLASLRAFEAAARHMSFARAADELGVTPTAISHQIKLLEDTLGTRLFERQPRRLLLTAAGRALHPGVREGFDALARAVRAVTPVPVRRSVTLSATSAFTAKRLVPHLAAFRHAHPDIDLHLHASDVPADLWGGAADMAIRYGKGPFPGLNAERLATNAFAPVCSPRLGVREPQDLGKVPLIHFHWHLEDADTPTWRFWSAQAGLLDLDAEAGLMFSDEGHAIQAAVSGHGVALLSLLLVSDELARGTLVQPFGPVLDGYAYHLVHAARSPSADRIDAVRSWLLRDVLGRVEQPAMASDGPSR